MATTGIESLLERERNLEKLENGKIRCKITGHEMPARLELLEKHLNSKKYKFNNYDYSQHLPYVVEHKRNPKKLYCRLTQRELNKIPEEVEAHVKGRRFQLRLKEREEKLQKKKEREESGIWIPDEEEDEDETALADQEDEEEVNEEDSEGEKEDDDTPVEVTRKKSRKN